MVKKQVSFVLLIVLVAVMVLNIASHDVSWDAKNTKETTGSWTGWAINKLWKGLGFKNADSVDGTTPRVNKDKIEEVVLNQQSPADLAGGKESAYVKATEKAHQAKQAAYETAKETINKASSLKDAATEKAHKVSDKAKEFTKQASDNTINIKDKAKQQAEAATDTAEDVRDAVHKEAAKEAAMRKAEEAKEKVDDLTDGSEDGESMSWVKSKAKDGYEGVKARASKTLHNAKEMAKDMVSPQYDDDEL